MNTFLSTFNIILIIILVGLGIAIWFTASQLLAFLFGVTLLILGGNITGLWSWLVSKFKKND